MTFTEHMKRIIELAEKSLVHVQEENYQKARGDLNNIHAHTSLAQQQLSNLEFTKAQDKIETDTDAP
ncbi:hypothetical protein ES705_36532 [subsurface metagenome]